MRHAFSLVELSIVLVILGLLTGGILTGQSLIRAAELRSVTTEYNRFQTAIQSFRNKYFALPGDMRNAITFWGDDVTNCSDGVAGNNGSPGTCNGNGDGIYSSPASGNATGETFQFWKQLGLAGLVEGTYTGLAGSAGGRDYDHGINSPASKFPNAGWGVWYLKTVGTTGVNYDFAVFDGNVLTVGGDDGNVGSDYRVFSGEEAWNIDTKIDDGKPGYCKLIGSTIGSCTTETRIENFATAQYNLTVSGAACSLRFKL
ncbi:MAG: hypothetical protein CMM93_05350 [Rickettsiales bacterium]|nr:hypothetical protein [Rickettsiales bacterium]|tara:strand:- start:972 stop:1745 length:774 start_codon:yes stop_codon:yes gene_type:complete